MDRQECLVHTDELGSVMLKRSDSLIEMLDRKIIDLRDISSLDLIEKARGMTDHTVECVGGVTNQRTCLVVQVTPQLNPKFHDITQREVSNCVQSSIVTKDVVSRRNDILGVFDVVWVHIGLSHLHGAGLGEAGTVGR